MTNSRYLRTVWATFNPKRLDTLRSEARGYVGERLKWMRAWSIEEEDSSVYAGQDAYTPYDRTVDLGWVPEEDLDEIEEATH